MQKTLSIWTTVILESMILLRFGKAFSKLELEKKIYQRCTVILLLEFKKSSQNTVFVNVICYLLHNFECIKNLESCKFVFSQGFLKDNNAAIAAIAERNLIKNMRLK